MSLCQWLYHKIPRGDTYLSGSHSMVCWVSPTQNMQDLFLTRKRSITYRGRRDTRKTKKKTVVLATCPEPPGWMESIFLQLSLNPRQTSIDAINIKHNCCTCICNTKWLHSTYVYWKNAWMGWDYHLMKLQAEVLQRKLSSRKLSVMSINQGDCPRIKGMWVWQTNGERLLFPECLSVRMKVPPAGTHILFMATYLQITLQPGGHLYPYLFQITL